MPVLPEDPLTFDPTAERQSGGRIRAQIPEVDVNPTTAIFATRGLRLFCYSNDTSRLPRQFRKHAGGEAGASSLPAIGVQLAVVRRTTAMAASNPPSGASLNGRSERSSLSPVADADPAPVCQLRLPVCS